MGTLMKTVIASVLAVAVTGPAAADPKFLGEYVGDKLKVQINVQGCKNFKENQNVAKAQFFNDAGFKQSGEGVLEGFTIFGDPFINFLWTERKVDKELTVAIDAEEVGACDDNMDPLVPADCGGIAGVVQAWLLSQNCGWMNRTQSEFIEVTKGQVKLSKDTDRAKVDFRVEGEYFNDDLKSKNWKFMIKSTNMDFVPFLDP